MAPPLYVQQRRKRALAVVLRALRRKAKISQEKAAEACHVSRQHLARLERGHNMIRLDSLMDIAEGYRTTGAEILTLIDRRLERYRERDSRSNPA